MKTYKDYLIDFDTLKVGDKVWSIEIGDCEVVLLSSYGVYPVEVASLKNENRKNRYTKHGLRSCTDIIPSLFKENPDFFKEKKEVKRWKWYFEDDYYINGNSTDSAFTEEEFLKNFTNLTKYGKIDCTEITEVVYE